MSEWLELTIPWWEIVLRASIVYFVLLALLRVSGKRTVGQFTPFDLLVLVLLGDAVQGSMIAGDESLPWSRARPRSWRATERSSIRH